MAWLEHTNWSVGNVGSDFYLIQRGKDKTLMLRWRELGLDKSGNVVPLHLFVQQAGYCGADGYVLNRLVQGVRAVVSDVTDSHTAFLNKLLLSLV